MNLTNSILRVLVYFDLFGYPVSESEIRQFLNQPAHPDKLKGVLDQLVREHFLFRHGDFFALYPDNTMLEKRLTGNARAQPLLIIANRVSGFLFRFPYVRGIGISGSLSKNFADESSDIDFFIITEANRLWIARTAMHLFKKLTFLTGHQHWFCMNYYVDGQGLQIEEKNIFTATELVTLMTVRGEGSIEGLLRANAWVHSYFPNFAIKPTGCPANRPNVFKRFLEWIFRNKMGDWLDDYFMKLTTRRWSLKEKRQKLNIKGNRMGLRTSKHFSKPNPVFFQEKILALYQRNLQEFEKKWNEMSARSNQPFFFKEII